MFVPVVTYPGLTISDPDASWASHMLGLIHSLVHTLDWAALALDAFIQQQAKYAHDMCLHLPAEERTARKMNRLAERDDWIRHKAAEQGVDPDSPIEHGLRDQLEAAYDQARWQGGRLPDTYQAEAVRTHARSFLFALDRLSKVLGALLDDTRAPDGVHAASTTLLEAIPDLRDLRNSIAHYEDRILGKGNRGRRIAPQAIANDLIQAPEGAVIVTESLNGDQFGSTAANGRFATIAVNEATLMSAQRCVQAVLNAFAWAGPGRRHPTWRIGEL